MGGAIGSVLRYAIMQISVSTTFPWHTFIVNVLGSFIIGICIASFKNNKIEPTTYTLLATGICGGFTTFSSFSADGLSLLEQNKVIQFGFYVLISVALGLLATYLGYKLIK